MVEYLAKPEISYSSLKLDKLYHHQIKLQWKSHKKIIIKFWPFIQTRLKLSHLMGSGKKKRKKVKKKTSKKVFFTFFLCFFPDTFRWESFKNYTTLASTRRPQWHTYEVEMDPLTEHSQVWFRKNSNYFHINNYVSHSTTPMNNSNVTHKI